MATSQKNITSLEVLNSVTNNIADEKLDVNAPFTFLQFLNYAKAVGNNILNFSQYTIYLKSWQTISVASNNTQYSDIKTQFLNLLTEIKIKYLTTEEKRFISNLDTNNEENLEIMIPFFSRKIKEICLYFANKRNTFKKDLRYIQQKGSSASISSVVKDTILSLVGNEDNTNNITSIKSLSSLSDDVVVEVERQYDVFNDYYDLDPSKPPQFYNAAGIRDKYFTSNTNSIVPEYFISEDDAITQMIHEEGITLKEIAGLQVNILSTDVGYLEKVDTIDYTSPTTSNLRYLLNKDLANVYMGTDFYYLSTNTLGNVVSGSLFDASTPHRNLLNTHFPSTLTVESDELLSERDIGLFFKPTYQGIIKMTSKFSYSIDYTKIENNKIYVFPDPTKYTNSSDLTNTTFDYPIVYTLNDKSVSRNISTSFGQNIPKTNNNSQAFNSYSSIEQKTFTPSYTGEFQSIQQIVSQGELFSCDTDIFGNIFVSLISDGYIDRNVNSSFIGGSPVSENFTDTSTLYDYISARIKPSIALKQLEPKQYYVIDITTQGIVPLSSGFSKVYAKYASTQGIVEELSNSIIDFAIFGNVFFIKTTNYAIIDTFKYDGTFDSTGDVPVIINYDSSPSVGNDITAVTTPFRVGNDIIYSVIETRNNLNLKYVIYSVYKYNVNTFTSSTIIDLNTANESVFSQLFTFQGISTNIVMIRQSNLIYNSKANMYCIITNFVDLNLMPLFHVLMFRVSNNELQIFMNKYFNPMNYNTTQNFYGADTLIDNFFTQAILSTPQQSTQYGTVSL